MTRLTQHFNLEEFERDGVMPPACIPMYGLLCAKVLEAVRAKFNLPIVITSGYRPPALNAEAHGVKNSQHIATAGYCAADFTFLGAVDMRPCFDWIRDQKGLIWDQVILEHGANSEIIHISLTTTVNRRMALEGETANQSAYTSFPAVEYQA